MDDPTPGVKTTLAMKRVSRGPRSQAGALFFLDIFYLCLRAFHFLRFFFRILSS